MNIYVSQCAKILLEFKAETDILDVNMQLQAPQSIGALKKRQELQLLEKSN
jgi:hypothetical protein